ncbi:MAG TPA: DUF2066 domain-containing protein [Nevskiaceae bacterium]|nr:DUF2066 domain-containing protein [Nevskiaceae bacterium]
MKFLSAMSALLLAFAAAAQTFDDYQAVVPVPNQSPEARDQALRDALVSVLTQVSGTGAIAPGRIAPVLAHPETLVRSVGYETGTNGALNLIAQFTPDAVDNTLKQLGLPVHGVLAGGLQDVTLRVSGISSAHGYGRVLSHLRAQPGVKNVSVLAAEGDALIATVSAEGGAARLAGALAVGGVLKRDPAEPNVMAFVLQK